MGVMERFDRITVDPARLNGQPCLRDTRLTVRRVVLAVAQYPDRERLRANYPQLDEEDVRQCLAYAADHGVDRMGLMERFDRITIEPGKMDGQPCIRGMRITVKRVLEVLRTYDDPAEIKLDYPDLEAEDFKQALGYAAVVLKQAEHFPVIEPTAA